MRPYSFIPFASLAALQGPELARLKAVSQGWYVDYRERLPRVSQLAKQLSGFANQSGGWLFVGVKGQDKGRMKASAFPGIPGGAVAEALAMLHEAASTHVTPPVLFDAKTIEGPVPEIGLAPGRCIIVVGVPQGAIPPYIHSSGRIYRRAGRHANPAPEMDRRELDILWGRARDTQQRLAAFLSLRSAVPEPAEAERMRALVYFLDDPYLANGSLGLSAGSFSDVMRSPNGHGFLAADFNTVFTTSDGYVARRLEPGEPLGEGPAFRWWANGNARLSIPVSRYDVSQFSVKADPRRSDFVRILRSQGLAQARIADFSAFLTLVAAVAGKYLQLRRVLGLGRAFWGKVRICEAQNAVPFINLRQYVESVKEYGLPIIQDDDFYAPPGLTTGDLIGLETSQAGDEKSQSVLLALRLAAAAFRAAGIDFDRFIREDPKGFLCDLAESMDIVVEGLLAGERSL